MHIGTARALLFNFLFARRAGGKIIFRSEDTDRTRSRTEFEREILAGLRWLGLDFDEGPFRQSERDAIYQKYFEQLRKSGAIYPCFCTTEKLEKEREQRAAEKLPPRYSGRCRELTATQIAEFESAGRQPVWRFRVPEGPIAFEDLVRGKVEELGQNIGDFVIRKSDGQFLYHFTVVVDDTEMQITHVIRGEDHISNTAKHILLFRALGAEIPKFAHLPLLLNHDRSKMSKRDASGQPATLTRLQTDGYLPEAVVNFLALLGWNPGDEREFFSLDELVAEFDFARVGKAGAVFDIERLNFFNQHYLRQLPLDELIEKIKPHLDFEVNDLERFKKGVELIRERLKFPAEAPAQLKFFFVEPEYAAELFVNAKMKVDDDAAQSALENVLPVLEKLPEWEEAKIKTALFDLIEKLGAKNGAILWPLRVALTGEKFSPGAFEVAAVLGQKETLARIRTGVDKLKSSS